jgi:hypothetical protein
MLARPQEGNKVVLIMGLWLSFIQVFFCGGSIVWFVVAMALLIPWSRRPGRPKHWQIRALAIAYLLSAAYTIYTGIVLSHLIRRFPLFHILEFIIEAVQVLLLNFRPRIVANLTSTPCGRRLISLAKVTSAIWLAAALLLEFYVSIPSISEYFSYSVRPFTILVLSLGSLQQPNHAADSHLFGRWTDAILHVFFLLHFMLPFPMIVANVSLPGLSLLAALVLSVVVLLASLQIGNLQIPAAVAQIVLSSLRLINLIVAHIDYNPLPRDSSPNMVVAIAVFYVLALCQGSLYITACILGLFSSFTRRWLMRRSKFGGKLGAKAIDLYYQHAYATLMEMGVFGTGAGSTFSFAIESLRSSSRDLQVAGLCVLHNMLQEQRRDCRTQDLILRITSGSDIAVSSTLIGMLAWAADVEEDGYAIRLLAAKVTAELASSLRISSIPGMLKPVSSLFENGDAAVLVPNQQGGPGQQQTPLAIASGGRHSWVVCRFWQQMKQEYWSVPEEPANFLTHQDSSLPVLGTIILEKLARDLDNCAEIFKDDTANLISKTIGIIRLATSDDNEQNDALVCSSLEFLRRLATTGERIGAALRHELWNHPFLLTCLARVLEDKGSSSSSSHQVWEPAMDIIAKLALDKEAGLEIGRIQVITERLLHAFLGRHGPTNLYYDLSLRKVSGEALANLALWGTANCSVILDEPGYQVINDLTSMLSDDYYRYVAASLLLNLCEHSSVNLLLSHDPRATEHLSSALPIVCLLISFCLYY